MPVVIEYKEEHIEFFGLKDSDLKDNGDYKKIIDDIESIIWDGYSDAIVRQSSGKFIINNKGQLDKFIEDLNSYREQLPD